jgi:hypothetical protein
VAADIRRAFAGPLFPLETIVKRMVGANHRNPRTRRRALDIVRHIVRHIVRRERSVGRFPGFSGPVRNASRRRSGRIGRARLSCGWRIVGLVGGLGAPLHHEQARPRHDHEGPGPQLS